jgi:rhodanese-related sulfurtransferase
MTSLSATSVAAELPIADPVSPGLEISLAAALELCTLGMASLVDIRQSFELDLKGAIPGAVHVPLCEVKLMLGHTLTDDEQDILDAGRPAPVDAQGFFTTLNRLHHDHDHLVLIICNSGRRSLHAAQLLRDLGYRRALSVAGGFLAWRKLQAAPQAQNAATAAAGH